MKRFIVNRHGRIVFPFNFFPDLDFSVFDTLEQFETVIRRDFQDKARSEDEIVARSRAGAYTTRYELLRDVAVHLFWVNRYAMTMYDKRPTRWRDVPRRRADTFLPVLEPWDGSAMVTAVEARYQRLPPTWDGESEQTIVGLLLDVLRKRIGSGLERRPVLPTVAEACADGTQLVYRLLRYAPDYPGYSRDDIIAYAHAVPELEALMRHAMVLHNQFRWDPADACLTRIEELRDDDVVVILHPRHEDVHAFIRRAHAPRTRTARPASAAPQRPQAPFPPVEVRKRFAIMPRIEAIAVHKPERACTNDDLIRNTAYCWSPMTAEDIRRKTGIEQRLYTELPLEEMALLAARAALAKSGRKPEDIAAVLFCSCTSTQTMPSVAAWLSARLGVFQTHASCDIVAACAGLPYGLAEAVRLLQESERPVLVVGAEKFSDKIGTVRASRMLFGDGAAALLVSPAPLGDPPDIEVCQTYASGPESEVDSIVWPNPEFDNAVTVYGPEVRALVRRYLAQMTEELSALSRPDGGPGSLLDAVDLIVPHQANKTMVTSLAREVGLPTDRLYFNVDRVGNTSSASIPLALHDAVRDGVIDRPMRVFAPGFGAGAVGGYVVMRVDPAMVA